MAQTVSPSLDRRSLLGLGVAAGCAALTGTGSSSASLAFASEVAVTDNFPYDLVIKNGNVYGDDNPTDLAIKDGIIVEHGTVDETQGTRVIDATGHLVSPSFVDSHTHLDKAFQMEYPSYVAKVRELEAEYLSGDEVDYGYPVCGGAEQFLMGELKKEASDDDLKKLVRDRISRALDMAIANGTGLIKTNNTWGPLSIEVANELKETYAGKIDLVNIVPFTQATEATDRCSLTFDELDSLATEGAIDAIGGYFDGDWGYDTLDALFAFADKHDLPVDIHVLETDVPLLKPLDYILDLSLAHGFGPRLTCGHLTSLDAPGIDPVELDAVVEKAAKAEMNATSLCSCNMYLMGRKAQAPVRRGITRIDLLQQAGVNTAFASDNIRDAWRPYGNADMLQEALICAHCMQAALPDELQNVFEMATVNPAKNALIEGYGTEVGCKADLVVLSSPTPDLAIIDQARKLYVVKGGAVVAEDGKLV